MSETAYDEVPVTSPRSPAVIMGGDTDRDKVDDDDDDGGHGHSHGGAGKTGCDKFKDMFQCTGCTPTLRTFAIFCALGGFMFGCVLQCRCWPNTRWRCACVGTVLCWFTRAHACPPARPVRLPACVLRLS